MVSNEFVPPKVFHLFLGDHVLCGSLMPKFPLPSTLNTQINTMTLNEAVFPIYENFDLTNQARRSVSLSV